MLEILTVTNNIKIYLVGIQHNLIYFWGLLTVVVFLQRHTDSANVQMFMHTPDFWKMCEHFPQSLSTGERTLEPRAVLHL